jgi:hypothetical protein
MKTRTRIMLAGLALGAALAGGVAWATIPADTSLYTACKLKATGTIRLIDPSGPSGSLLSRCTSLETQVSWSQNGQKGDPGPAGARGSTASTARTGSRRQRHGRGEGRERTGGQPEPPAPRAIGREGDPASRANRATGPQGLPGHPAAARPPSRAWTDAVRPPGGRRSDEGDLHDRLDSDAVSITCDHPVARVTLQVALNSRNEVWDCSGPFGPTSYCSNAATGTVAVSPADMTGKSSCALPFYNNTTSANVGVTCMFLFVPGTTVTLTASTPNVFLGWQAPYQSTPTHACVGTTTAACTVTLTENRAVRAALDF